MPRVRKAHWGPGEWPLPLCPGSNGPEACGAPVKSYRAPGGEDPVEIDWTSDDPVMCHPCSCVVPAKALGVVLFRSRPLTRDEAELARIKARPEQTYLTEYG